MRILLAIIATASFFASIWGEFYLAHIITNDESLHHFWWGLPYLITSVFGTILLYMAAGFAWFRVFNPPRR